MNIQILQTMSGPTLFLRKGQIINNDRFSDAELVRLVNDGLIKPIEEEKIVETKEIKRRGRKKQGE